MEERISSGLYSLVELRVDRVRLNLGHIIRPWKVGLKKKAHL
jgi:hypothetical protein